MAGRIRLMVAIVVARAAGAITTAQSGWRFGLLIGLAVLCVVYSAWSWVVMWPFDGDQTRLHAQEEEPGRLVSHVLVVLLAFGSLASVALLLFGGGGHPRPAGGGGVAQLRRCLVLGADHLHGSVRAALLRRR